GPVEPAPLGGPVEPAPLGGPAAPAPIEGPAAPAPPAARGEPVRVRLCLAKRLPASHASHLEYMLAVLRALRRAGWPLAYSQGFHPKVRASFGPACPTGIESAAEWVEVQLGQPAELAPLERALAAALPPGLELVRLERVAEGAPALSRLISAVRYRIELDGIGREEARAARAEWMQRARWEVERQGKAGRRRIDIRPSVLRLELERDAGGFYADLTVLAGSSQGEDRARARPGEVAGCVFGLTAPRIRREGVLLAEERS
ncbi:MAG: DUF2344 domain-containing protein, partial [Deltaproteobacteria bacterium]|nr:DUF2344 domain-containing protein [Deltaproteobacteria bacterium]